MKNRMLLLFALVLGAIVGAGGGWLFCHNERFKSSVVDASYTRIVDDVTTLTRLRRNQQQELLENKEQQLAMEVAALCPIISSDSLPPKEQKYLMMVVRYREQFALSTGFPELDRNMNELLDAIQKNGLAPDSK